MSRFTGPLTYNTGSIAAAGNYQKNLAVSASVINVAKIKVVPSGSTIGWVLEAYKKNTFLAADKQYSTKTNVVGSFYDPTDRNGLEVLEGWVLPYEDLDVSKILHLKWTNNDPVARSADISIWYEDPAASLISGYTISDLTAQTGVTITLPYTPVSGTVSLFRGGLYQRQVSGVYTIAGAVITLSLPKVASEELVATYFKVS